MKLDVNINNKQKHWVLVILDKIKIMLCSLFSLIIKGVKIFFNFIKRFWKLLTAIIVIVGIVIACYYSYDYYVNTYVPEKKLTEAFEDIENKFHKEKESIRLEYASHILDKKYTWNYEGVNEGELSSKLYSLRDEAFKMIESKAFEGDPQYQYFLGQLYFHEDLYYCQKDEKKAVYWWNEAAENNYIKAYNNLGIAYRDGIGVKISKRKAVEYLKEGAEAGDDYAQWNYGTLFKDGLKVKTGTHKETKKTTDYYYNGEKIREYYDDRLMEFVTVYQEEVDDYETLIPKDIEQAKFWWKKAAAQGNEGAKEALQQIYN